MTEEARAEQNRYQREYRKAHPERVKKWNQSYWAKRAEARAGEVAEG